MGIKGHEACKLPSNYTAKTLHICIYFIYAYIYINMYQCVNTHTHTHGVEQGEDGGRKNTHLKRGGMLQIMNLVKEPKNVL